MHNIYKNTHQQQPLLRAINSVPRQTFCHQINANEYDAKDPINIILLKHKPAYPSNEEVTYLFQNIETYDENNVYT